MLGIDAALKDVRSGRTLPVPQELRDSHYKGAERLGHGKGYQYAHDFEGHFVAQDYLGAARRYYEPTEQGAEKKNQERLDKWREQIEATRLKPKEADRRMTLDLTAQKGDLRRQIRAQFEGNDGGRAAAGLHRGVRIVAPTSGFGARRKTFFFYAAFRRN